MSPYLSVSPYLRVPLFLAAAAAGVGRASLYKSLSEHGHPEFTTILKVIKALGLRLTVAA